MEVTTAIRTLRDTVTATSIQTQVKRSLPFFAFDQKLPCGSAITSIEFQYRLFLRAHPRTFFPDSIPPKAPHSDVPLHGDQVEKLPTVGRARAEKTGL
jgi:hypothetical protein